MANIGHTVVTIEARVDGEYMPETGLRCHPVLNITSAIRLRGRSRFQQWRNVQFEGAVLVLLNPTKRVNASRKLLT